MPKGRQPVILPALEKAYGKNWKTKITSDFSNLTLDQGTEKLSKDSGIVISSSSLYVFLKKEMNFSFKSTGKKGKQPILLPALQKKYGDKWLESFKNIFTNNFLEKATEILNKELGISISSGYLGTFAKNNNIEIKKDSGPSKPRGKKSKVIPLLLNHFKTEDNIRDFLKQHNNCKIVEITEILNKEANTSIPVANVYNIAKKYGVEFNRSHRKSDEPKGNSKQDTPQGIEVKTPPKTGIPVKFVCQTPNCNGSIGVMVEPEYGFALRARRCSSCGKFGTMKAQYREKDQSVTTIVLKQIDGITCEVKEQEEMAIA